MTGAGELNRLLTLDAPTRTPGATGERATTWTQYAQVWGHVQPLAGRELERAKAFGATVSTRIRIRYRADITTEHRARYGSHVYLINAALAPDEAHDFTDIYATEVPP